MDQSTTPARAGYKNWMVPVVYGIAVVLVAVFASGTVTSIVAVVGGVLVGLYYAFIARRRRTGP